MPKKLRGGPLGTLQHFCCETSNLLKEGHFGEKNFGKKTQIAEKGDPLVSPDIVCCAEKRNKPFGYVPWAEWSILDSSWG